MKKKNFKLIFWLFLCFTVSVKNVQSQKIGDVAAIATGFALMGTAVAIAATNEAAREAVERNMVEWVLANKSHPSKTTFYLSLLKWEAAKREDLNNVSVIGFSYHEYSNWQNVLLLICSRGWVNEQGVDFTKVLVYEINKERLSKILLAYLNLSKKIDEQEITDLNKIPVITNKNSRSSISIKGITAINNNNIEFENSASQKFIFKFNENLLGSNVHTVINIDDELKLDFNEGDLNIYLKSTNNTFALKRNFLLEVIKKVWGEVYQ